MKCSECYYGELDEKWSCNWSLFNEGPRPDNCFCDKEKDYNSSVGCNRCKSFVPNGSLQGYCKWHNKTVKEYTPSCCFFNEGWCLYGSN